MENVKDRNILLIKRIAEGDDAALDELVRLNTGLVRSIASRYADRGTELEDLVQIGTIGLIRAARGFDTSYGTVFSTYAVPLIAGEIKRFLRDDGAVKIGRELRRRARLAAMKRAEYIAENGKEPKISTLAKLCALSCEETAEALCASVGVRSLSETTGDSESLTLESQIEDPADRITSLTENIALYEAVASLGKMQKAIVHLRFTLELSQAQTGKLLGVSQVKVSREEKKILEALRKAL